MVIIAIFSHKYTLRKINCRFYRTEGQPGVPWGELDEAYPNTSLPNPFDCGTSIQVQNQTFSATLLGSSYPKALTWPELSEKGENSW